MNGNQYAYFRAGFLSVLLSALLTVAVGAKDQEAFCNWLSGPAQTDGRLDEWKNMPTTFFEEERLILGLSNDSSFLYLFLRTDDPSLIRTIRMSGIKLWLAPGNKKKKDLEFNYQGGPGNDELVKAGLVDSTQQERSMGHDERMPPAFRQREMGDRIVLIDKKLELEQPLPTDGSQGPTVRYGFDRNFCVYEFSIPLQDHQVDYYGFGAQPGQEIRVGIKWGGKPDFGKMGEGPPGGGGGGNPGDMGGMPPGGGKGGGRPGGMRGGPGGMQADKEKEFWIKTTLTVAAPVKK